MTRKPLHESCDKIYANIARLDGVRNNIDSMRLPTADRRIKEAMDELDSILSTVREIALRVEGNHL